MVLKGKLVGQIEIKFDGDVYHEIFRERQHHISNMSPDKVQGVDLYDGEWGTAGSVVNWKFTHEGKQKVTKCIIEGIDEAKKKVNFNIIEGDIADQYKVYKSSVQVDNNGGYDTVTWTIEYERKNEDVPDPISYLEFLLHLTRDIEAHHLK